jgi:hypothetical protein
MLDKVGFIIVSEPSDEPQELFPGRPFSCAWLASELGLPENATVFVEREVPVSEARRLAVELGLSGLGVSDDQRYYAAVAE